MTIRKAGFYLVNPRPFDSDPPAPSWADTKSAELAAVSRRERAYRIGLAWLVSIGLLAVVAVAIWATTP